MAGCRRIRLGGCGRIRWDGCGRLQKEEFTLSLASVGSLDHEDIFWDLKRELTSLVNMYIYGAMCVLLGCLLIACNGTCCIAGLFQIDLYKLNFKISFFFKVFGFHSALDGLVNTKLLLKI